MAIRLKYYVRRDGTAVGPLSTAQINRMFQRGEIGLEFECRSEAVAEWRRLGEVLPHLHRNKAGDPERIEAIKREVENTESTWLIRTGIVSALFFWTPAGLGVIAASSAIGCGLVLLLRHRRVIGVLPILMGLWGLAARFMARF